MNLYIKYIFKRLNETKLPVKETSIAHCKFKIWSEFVMKNMGDYQDLHLKTDVLLLKDILEEFRKTCL